MSLLERKGIRYGDWIRMIERGTQFTVKYDQSRLMLNQPHETIFKLTHYRSGVNHGRLL